MRTEEGRRRIAHSHPSLLRSLVRFPHRSSVRRSWRTASHPSTRSLLQPAPCRRSVSSPLDNDHITTRAVLRSLIQTRTCAICCQSGGVERDDAAAAVRCHSARRDSAEAQPTAIRSSLRRHSQDKRASLDTDLTVERWAAPCRAPVCMCSRCRIVGEVRPPPSSRHLRCLSGPRWLSDNLCSWTARQRCAGSGKLDRQYSCAHTPRSVCPLRSAALTSLVHSASPRSSVTATLVSPFDSAARSLTHPVFGTDVTAVA